MTGNKLFSRAGGLILAASTSLLLVSCTKETVTEESVAWSSCPSPQDIPANFDYPQDASTIEGWVDAGDVARTREHGWNLWAALNVMNGDQAIWQSWCTETQAFSTDAPTTADDPGPVDPSPVDADKPMRAFKLEKGLQSGPEPINFPYPPIYDVPQPVADKYKGSACLTGSGSLANGPTLQNNGDVMIAGVIYNQPAFDWIRKNKLYEQATLEAMKPPKDQTKQMPPMPDGSIVLKPMLWPVMGSGYTALPVWDDLSTDNGVYSGFEIQSQWPRAVAVTADEAPIAVPGSVTYLHGVKMKTAGSPPYPALGPNTYSPSAAVGVQEFYNYKPDLNTMAECDKALLDASAYYAYGRMFEQGDYLILIAMHIMTKEQPAWTFQSVWWHDKPDQGPYAANRPAIAGAKGPWQHYLMAATYGIPDPASGGTQWPIAYNPYIELAADHPIQTNCMNCHKRAAWKNTGHGYLAPGGPSALDIFNESNPTIFNGRIGVDSLWSISDRAQPAPSGAKGEK